MSKAKKKTLEQRLIAALKNSMALNKRNKGTNFVPLKQIYRRLKVEGDNGQMAAVRGLLNRGATGQSDLAVERIKKGKGRGEYRLKAA